MDNISDLIPFARLRQLSVRDVSSHIDPSSNFDNLLIYEGSISIGTYITDREYFPLNKRYVAKLHHKPEDAFYEFTVFDLWSEKEM
jgi:hypothetical protein